MTQFSYQSLDIKAVRYGIILQFMQTHGRLPRSGELAEIKTLVNYIFQE